jgi:hypothetical protein
LPKLPWPETSSVHPAPWSVSADEGSVAHAVAEHAGHPVLIVPPAEAR